MLDSLVYSQRLTSNVYGADKNVGNWVDKEVETFAPARNGLGL